jgi:hypothetical protein
LFLLAVAYIAYNGLCAATGGNETSLGTQGTGDTIFACVRILHVITLVLEFKSIK